MSTLCNLNVEHDLAFVGAFVEYILDKYTKRLFNTNLFKSQQKHLVNISIVN